MGKETTSGKLMRQINRIGKQCGTTSQHGKNTIYERWLEPNQNYNCGSIRVQKSRTLQIPSHNYYN